jgi:hypothetical protein
MENLDVALKTLGLGMTAVFTLMACISLGIWIMGRVFVFLESRVERRRARSRVGAAPSRRMLRGSA